MNLIFCSTLPRVEQKAPRVEEPKFGGWSTRFGESRHYRRLSPKKNLGKKKSAAAAPQKDVLETAAAELQRPITATGRGPGAVTVHLLLTAGDDDDRHLPGH